MVAVPASEIADKIGSMKLLNMVLVGSFMSSSKAFSEASLSYALKKSTGKHQDMLPFNEKAIGEGTKYAG
ncbi:MAG TPA: hypothetical protein DC017_08065 [Candidatus Wallbacteria bacterium]|nr:hypothetical protein [Candidatus Wallbacteria bacterium]